MTPKSGDLIYQVAANPTFPATSWTEMAGATALSLNNINGLAAQYLVSNGSALNPGFALSPSGDWVTVAVAIAPNSGGGDVPGMHVVKTDFFYQSNMTQETFKFPVAGNLTVGIWDSDQDISSISSTPAATWLNAVSNSGPNSGYTDIYYARPAGPQTYSITLTNPGLVAQGTMLMYDVTGADPHASVELTATHGGYMGSSGNLDAGSITPASANPGLLFFVTSIEIEGLIGVVSPANGIWDAGGNKQDPPAGHASGYGEDGWGHALVQCSSLPCSPIEVVWATTGAVHGWNTSMALFSAGTTAPANDTLTATKAGNGTGTILSDDGQISCATGCNSAAGSYASGTTVTLAASPDSNSAFAGWSGCDSVAGANCSITMNSNRTATANFNLIPTYMLTVSKAGTGGGTVTSSPAGISCGATCSAAYNSGAAVTLTASADAASTFAGWSGAGCSGTGKCVVTMDAAKSVTATFDTTLTGAYPLTVSKAGLGSGTVTSSPPGINCGASCSANVTGGTSVTLTAAAAPGSTFAGWGGCGSVSGTSCTVVMNSSQTVTTTFDAKRRRRSR